MNKKLLIVIGAIIVTILVLFIIISQQGAIAAFTFNSNNALVIGASLSLTGKTASYGEDIRNGMELAVDHIKESKTPLNIRILYDDTGSSLEKAVISAQKFIEVDGAKVIINVGADDVLTTAPVTEAKGVILFSPIAGSDNVDSAGKYVFRNRESSKLTAYALAELLAMSGYKKVALFVASSSSSPASYEQAFIEKFPLLGGNIVLDFHYNENQPDIRTGILKAIDADASAVYVVASKDKDGAKVVQQLKELGYEGLIVGGPALETTNFFVAAKEAAEGVIIASPPVDLNAPNAKQILETYKAKYGREMSFSAANAFDMVNLLNAAAGKCESDTDCTKEYLLFVKDYPGIGGKTTFNPNGGVTKPLSLKIAKDGKFVPYPAQ